MATTDERKLSRAGEIWSAEIAAERALNALLDILAIKDWERNMSFLRRDFLAVIFAGVAIVAQAAWAAEPYTVTVERGVQVKMRDGTVLPADIYRPKAEGTFPVLLHRTPYDKNAPAPFTSLPAPAPPLYLPPNQR